MRIVLTALCCSLFVACVAKIELDENEKDIVVGAPLASPTAQFDPSNRIVPLPNNLLVDPQTGLINLPQSCFEEPTSTSYALRVGLLNTLNGYSNWLTPLQVAFDETVDLDSLADRAYLVRILDAGVPVDPTLETAIPLNAIPGETTRFADQTNFPTCADPFQVDNVTFIPALPLKESSTYAVALLEGITTFDGTPYIASPTWFLTRQKTPLVEIETGLNGDNEPVITSVTQNNTIFDPLDREDELTMIGLDLLWKAHAGGLTALDGYFASQDLSVGRSDILLAWSFNTQTASAPLDPLFAGSPASSLGTLTSDTAANITPIATDDGAGPANTVNFLDNTFGSGYCDSLAGACDTVGSINQFQLDVPIFQTQLDNPAFSSIPRQGPWNSVLTPTQATDSLGDPVVETVSAWAIVPNTTMPTDGYPVVIYGHGITRSKEDLLAFAAQFNQQGIAVVGIDWVAHGARAILLSNDADCDDPTDTADLAAGCFDPFLSALDLTITRDNIRQSILDQLKLVRVLKACGTDSCGGIQVDGDNIGYMGQSLGGIMGVSVSSLSPDIKASVINVGAVDWVGIFTDSGSDAIRCGVIDGLITLGIISGTTVANAARGMVPTCLTDDWRSDPGFVQFSSVARWILDPAEGATFLGRIFENPTKMLIQQVDDDGTVPNSATNMLGGILGGLGGDPLFAPEPANTFILTDGIPTATSGATMSENGWILYSDIVDGNTNVNTYDHGSILLCATDCPSVFDVGPSDPDYLAGVAGTAQMRFDAITFFVANL